MYALNAFSIFGAKPDILAGLVIFFALLCGAGTGLEAGILAGALKDLLSLDYFGINAVSLGICGLVAGMAASKVSRDSGLSQFSIGSLFTAVSMSLHYSIASAVSGSGYPLFADIFISRIVPSSIYTGIFCVLIFRILSPAYGPDELEDLL